MMRGFLALGANLGERRAQIEAAIAALAREPGIAVRRRAGYYETEALGSAGSQPPFLNTIVEVETDLAPETLLERCLAIERRLGRVREVRWAPRQIDIDLVWFEGCERQSAALTLPHPEAHRRSFVLAPLAELEPGHVLAGRPIAELLAAAEPRNIRRLP